MTPARGESKDGARAEANQHRQHPPFRVESTARSHGSRLRARPGGSVDVSQGEIVSMCEEEDGDDDVQEIREREARH